VRSGEEARRGQKRGQVKRSEEEVRRACRERGSEEDVRRAQESRPREKVGRGGQYRRPRYESREEVEDVVGEEVRR